MKYIIEMKSAIKEHEKLIPILRRIDKKEANNQLRELNKMKNEQEKEMKMSPKQLAKHEASESKKKETKEVKAYPKMEAKEKKMNVMSKKLQGKR